MNHFALNGVISPQELYYYALRAVAMLIVIPFHESAHALISWKLGDSTAKDMGRLSMNPLRHFDPLGALCMIAAGVGWAKPVGINPTRFKNPKRGMAVSAAAGPLSNFLLAYAAMLLYKVVYYACGGAAPQLVLMDIKLPFYNGYHWCSRIREVSKVPVIFVSSASDNMNIVMAVNMGGDDFIAKPFDLDVLTAKIQVLLRRTYDFAGQNTVLEHRGALLNLGDATLTCGETRVDLTKNELKILQVLMENKGKTVSRDVLMQRLWETDSFVDENTLTVNVNRLRKKLEAAGLSEFIRTRFGVGYLVE